MPRKKLTGYIETAPDRWAHTLADYAEGPATAFLTEVVHLSDAINQCRRLFTKTRRGDYTKDSQDSLYRLNAATLASVMSHFETYQRFLFAGLIEATRLAPGFSVDKVCRSLAKDSGLQIDPVRVSAYRGQPAPIGQLIADNLAGWQDPTRVNDHFRAVIAKLQFYSKKESEILQVLWQMRHSIVHTAGWITQPDSQKVKELNPFGNSALLLGGRFIEVVGRRLHPVVRDSVGRLSRKFASLLTDDLDPEETAEVTSLFSVKSPRRSWFE